jgi:hypothetical protein
MLSELALGIQQHVMQYLSGVASLSEFEDWFVPALWDLDGENEDTRKLAGTVHIFISEFSRGDRTLQELREGLAETIRTEDENRYGDLIQGNGQSRQLLSPPQHK